MSGERMTHSARTLLRNRRDRFAGLEIRLKASKLSNAQAQRQTIARGRERVLRLSERARRALGTAMQRDQARVAHSGQLLAALSYRSVLARGFALVRGPESHPLRAAAAVVAGMRLDIEFHDGHVDAVAGNHHDAKPPADAVRPKPRRRPGGEGQGSLFGA
jgi:exodeoxyribonuclease VII large subunit